MPIDPKAKQRGIRKGQQKYYNANIFQKLLMLHFFSGMFSKIGNFFGFGEQARPDRNWGRRCDRQKHGWPGKKCYGSNILKALKRNRYGGAY